MSIDIWPPISTEDLKTKEKESLKRELDWIVGEIRETTRDLKHGLEDCYALLSPIEPGSTLVMSTPRNEKVKGHITRVGTRLVRGTIHLQLQTLHGKTISLNPDRPIEIAPLARIHTTLSECIDLLTLALSMAPDPTLVAAQLRALAHAIAECSSLLKGRPLTEPDESWMTCSCTAPQFSPPLPTNVSFHLGIQESSIVLWLRSLEPVDAPVHFGTKLGLAIGTVRRLEHDEMDRVFEYRHLPVEEDLHSKHEHHGKHEHGRHEQGRHEHGAHQHGGREQPSRQSAAGPSKTASKMGEDAAAGKPATTEVYVREKVRVESADPSLMSVSAKLLALSFTLAQTRRNLAAVMGEELED